MTRLPHALPVLLVILLWALFGVPRPVALPVEFSLEDAEQLYQQERWKEARDAYAAALKRMDDPLSPAGRQAIQRAVECSLKLDAWDDAHQLVQDYGKALVPLQTEEERYEYDEEKKARKQAARIERLEFHRQLVLHLGEQLDKQPKLATPPRRTTHAEAHIRANNRLVDHLLGPGFTLGHEYGLSLAGWWDAFAPDPAEAAERRERWWMREAGGVPLNPNGQPRFLQLPERYEAGLGRGRKVLFLLREIERRDPTPNGEHAAQALIRRAHISRVVYGPQNEPGWGNAEFYYRYAHRPSFEARWQDLQTKPAWELGDDEARTTAGGRLKVITLPPEESPLTLLRRVEQQYPRSHRVAEAKYVRAVYYQSRQQFGKALEVYEAIRKDHPDSSRARDARRQIDRIRVPGVLLGRTRVAAAGTKPQLWFAHRMTERVEFSAQSFDFQQYIADIAKEAPWSLDYLGQSGFFEDHFRFRAEDDDRNAMAKYQRGDVTRWTERPAVAEHLTTQTTTAPLTKAGAYLIEARVPGRKGTSRTLVLVTDVAIVAKQIGKTAFLYVCDANTGQPRGQQELRCCFTKNDRTAETLSLKTNDDGVCETVFPTDPHFGPFVYTVSPRGGVAFLSSGRSDLGRPYRKFEEQRRVSAVVTDRPVYRPGDTVHFRLWLRDMENRATLPAAEGTTVRVEVLGPSRTIVKSLELRTDRYGAVSGSYPLSMEVALGRYLIGLRPSEWETSSMLAFQVEEYKKPEFAVTVTSAQSQAAPGGKVPVRLQARYYYGAPVSSALVRYQVTRLRAESAPAQPKEFDWLYGPGHGSKSLRYPWLSGPQEELPESASEEDEYPYYRERIAGEPVASGELRLDAQGEAELLIDTADKQTASANWRYTIVAEVRDASRRTVKGQGTLLVSPRERTAVLELDRGWYTPGSEAAVTLWLGSASGQGIAAKGELQLYHATYQAVSAESTAVQEIIHQQPVETDSQGRAALRVKLPNEGQYRLVFQTKDRQGRDVRADAVFWVYDPSLKAVRGLPLEMIPEKRYYRPGETARVLLYTTQANARVLLRDNVTAEKPRLRWLNVPAHFAILDVPITARQMPNWFIEATVVSAGKVHVQTCELLVPPVRELLQVQLQTDKAEYRPGEKGTVAVTVTDAQGRPVAGQVTLTAFDKAVTALHAEPERTLFRFLTERLQHYHGKGSDSLQVSFSASGIVNCPQFEFYDGGLPEIGAMGGSPPRGGDMTNDYISRPSQNVRGPGFRETLPLAEPVLRKNFADTALWRPVIELSAQGKATAELTFPDSLTSWRLRAYAVTPSTQLGEAAAHVTTAKKLLLRLQTPRFLVEQDEVMLCANVHNYLATPKAVTAELLVPDAFFAVRAGAAKDAQGNLVLQQQATIAPGGEHRFEWPVQVKRAGTAVLQAKALTEEESDAMQVPLPILKRGLSHQTAQSGSFGQKEEGQRRLTMEVPAGSDAEETRLELSVSLGPLGAMLEAIPFLIDYPYGCTEQTMSRFYPAVLSAQTLKTLGLKLEDLAKAAPPRPGPADRFPDRRAAVFDSGVLGHITRAGLDRLAKFQHQDGGWGWWENDTSSTYMTAYVLLGLHSARQAGADVSDNVYESGFWYLSRNLRVGKVDAGATLDAEVLHVRALAAYVFTAGGPRHWKRPPQWGAGELATQRKELLDTLYEQRRQLTPYGLALLALALHHDDDPRAAATLDLLKEEIDRDPAQGTAWVRTQGESWWRWWRNDIETNAWVLRALVTLEPGSDLAAGIVQGLLNRRFGGTSWRSTRDTALAIAALADYVRMNKEALGTCKLTLHVDGQPLKEWTISRDNALSGEHRVLLSGEKLAPGRHELVLSKQGQGRLFYATHLRYWRKEVAPEGKGLKIQRDVYRILPDGTRDRQPLAEGAAAATGDLLDVVLTVTADANYDYVALASPRPAGCEPVQLLSGSQWLGGTYATVEIRDTQTLFFLPWLSKGTHVFTTRLRVETPGQFHMLPAHAFAMYAPEIRAVSGPQPIKVP